jgi:hypothetical protein
LEWINRFYKCSHAAKDSANYGSILLPSFTSLSN